MRPKSDIPYENSHVMARSRHEHSEDVRHNQSASSHAFNKPRDTRSEKSKAFAARWLGHS
jgi:hypothetical protein